MLSTAESTIGEQGMPRYIPTHFTCKEKNDRRYVFSFSESSQRIGIGNFPITFPVKNTMTDRKIRTAYPGSNRIDIYIEWCQSI